jgi:hypothetical protein
MRFASLAVAAFAAVFVSAFHGAVVGAQRSPGVGRLPGQQQSQQQDDGNNNNNNGDGDGVFGRPMHDGGPLARACKDIAEGKLCTVEHRHPGRDDNAQEDPDAVGICQKMLDGGVHCHILHPSARSCLDKVRELN